MLYMWICKLINLSPENNANGNAIHVLGEFCCALLVSSVYHSVGRTRDGADGGYPNHAIHIFKASTLTN